MNRGTLAPAALLALGLATTAAAQTQYQVTIDTSSLSGTTGNVDFQFNPFGAAGAATDTISGFTSAGSLPVTVTNGTGFNDYSQTFTFGISLTSLTTISGRTVSTPLLTNALDGSVAEITVNPNGTSSPQANPNSDGSASAARGTRKIAPPVPEPSTLMTFAVAGLGLLGLAILARKRKAAIKSA